MEMMDLINGVLGGLVGITAGCFVYTAKSSLIVGAIGAILVLFSAPLVIYLLIYRKVYINYLFVMFLDR